MRLIYLTAHAATATSAGDGRKIWLPIILAVFATPLVVAAAYVGWNKASSLYQGRCDNLQERMDDYEASRRGQPRPSSSLTSGLLDHLDDPEQGSGAGLAAAAATTGNASAVVYDVQQVQGAGAAGSSRRTVVERSKGAALSDAEARALARVVVNQLKERKAIRAARSKRAELALDAAQTAAEASETPIIDFTDADLQSVSNDTSQALLELLSSLEKQLHPIGTLETAPPQDISAENESSNDANQAGCATDRAPCDLAVGETSAAIFQQPAAADDAATSGQQEEVLVEPVRRSQSAGQNLGSTRSGRHSPGDFADLNPFTQRRH